MDKHQEFLYNVTNFKEMLDAAYSDAMDAYEVLGSKHGDLQYQMSLCYLNMSFLSYHEAKRIYHLNQMEHYEIEPFFTAYEDFKFQLKQVITNKDTNTSWLHGTYERLIENKTNLDKFISNTLKSANK